MIITFEARIMKILQRADVYVTKHFNDDMLNPPYIFTSYNAEAPLTEEEQKEIKEILDRNGLVCTFRNAF